MAINRKIKGYSNRLGAYGNRIMQWRMTRIGVDAYLGHERAMRLWTRIFHMRPHSIGETRFLFVKNWFLKKSWSRHLFYFYFWRENKTRNKTLKKWFHNFWKSVSLKNPSLSPGIRLPIGKVPLKGSTPLSPIKVYTDKVKGSVAINQLIMDT